MAKILLVEDDNNLREIYEARLQAEGYDIVSAPDGEAALVVAKKELPDLVISDVMMPRISGFEMLDIMRNTEGLKNVKVIMLTALGQAEDKTRADALGADKYLVKSQVTLEDIVKSAAELLGTTAAAPATPATAEATATPTATQAMPVAVAPAPSVPVAEPPAAAPAPASPVTPAPTTPAAPVQPAPAAPSVAADLPAPSSPAPAATPAPVAPVAPMQPLAPATPAPAIADPATTAAAATPGAPAQPTVPASSDDQLVADAVKDLIDGTPAEASSPQTPPAVTPDAPSPTPTAPPVLPTPEPAAAPAPVVAPVTTPPTTVQPSTPPQPTTPPTPAEPAAKDDESATKKKIIQPLAPGTADPLPKTDLNELMAKEGHTFDEQQPHDSTPPHQPGHVISPNPVSPTGQPEDPNKISL